MGDHFDPSALMIALDATEQAGVPPHVVDGLREMVERFPALLEGLEAAVAGNPVIMESFRNLDFYEQRFLWLIAEARGETPEVTLRRLDRIAR